MVDGPEEWFAALAHRRNGKGHENGDKQHLQQVAAHEGVEESFGDDVE